MDDFVGVRQLLREALRSLGARHIDQASSGGEAMGLLARVQYDVILCDFNLGEGKAASMCWRRPACAAC